MISDVGFEKTGLVRFDSLGVGWTHEEVDIVVVALFLKGIENFLLLVVILLL